MRLSHPEESEEVVAEAKLEVPTAESEAADKISFNKWEASNLGNEAQTEKFRRLMGIKTSKAPEVKNRNFSAPLNPRIGRYRYCYSTSQTTIIL